MSVVPRKLVILCGRKRYLGIATSQIQTTDKLEKNILRMQEAFYLSEKMDQFDNFIYTSGDWDDLNVHWEH